MITRKILLCMIALMAFAMETHAQWKAYLSYYEPKEIEQANDGIIYVLASGGLFSYSTQDQEVRTYDKTTLLSDCQISHIAWCKSAKKLVIAYDDYNIDLLSQNDDVVNMPAYMNTSMTVDKTINSVDIHGNDAYISTNFGIVRLNVANASFTDTYQLGFRVDYSYIENNYIYAASSSKGLYRAELTSNLLNPGQWTHIGNFTARPKTMDTDLLATVNKVKPDGPKYNHFGFMKMHNGILYTCGGGYNVISDLNYPGCIQLLNNGKWSIYQDNIENKTGIPYKNVGCLEIDPKDDGHVFAGAINGLYEFNNGLFTNHYTYDNSPLAPTFSNNKNYVFINGLKYDENGDLWIFNSMNNEQNILKYSSEKKWQSLYQKDLKGLAMLSTPTIDSRGLMWFVNENWQKPSFYAYQKDNNTLTCFVAPFINQDGTQIDDIFYIYCIVEDKSHNMWIGTDQGPFMLTTDQMDASLPVYTQVKVPRNDGTNYADYLLSGVCISCMYIDNNNRKWFGTTANGLYVIDSDNITTLAHFTKDNSKLLSDNISSLAFNESTGEMYIGTDRGLCSYTSHFADNSEGMTKENVWAYPNPVRPGYTGPITITGIKNGATVKIVTSSGSLVNEGSAENGQYKWYGLDRNGQRVASGVYMVEIATSEGDKGMVCKIAIVN